MMQTFVRACFAKERQLQKMENNRMTKGPLLQDPFLNTLRREKVPVSIYLVNGIKLQGLIESFDQFVVLLKNTVSQMVYKHAISTVVPARNVSSPIEFSHSSNQSAVNGSNGNNGNVNGNVSGNHRSHTPADDEYGP